MPDLAGDVVEQTETTLLALLDAILAAHQGINEERISIEGDDLPIGPHALTTIALLLHELATNAVKYGGLATPEGQLRIEVGIAGERMKMTWRETGAPANVRGKSDEGFGRRLERASVATLHGKVERAWFDHGLEIGLEFPVGDLGR